jgi:hypothetical protein
MPGSDADLVIVRSYPLSSSRSHTNLLRETVASRQGVFAFPTD